jgi:hypothetical protein
MNAVLKLSSVTVRRLLEQGQSHASMLALQRRVREELVSEGDRVARTKEEQIARAPEILAAGQAAFDASGLTLARLDLQAQTVRRRLADTDELLRLLEDPSVIAQFEARDAAFRHRRDANREALEQVDDYLRAAAAALQRADRADPVLRGCVQRFGDLIEVAWSEGMISPAVRHRSGQTLAEIFAGGRRPHPPRAA